MTRFELLQKVNGVKEYSRLVFEMARKADSADGLAVELSSEIPEDGLQTIKSVAKKGVYPLSLDGIQ